MNETQSVREGVKEMHMKLITHLLSAVLDLLDYRAGGKDNSIADGDCCIDFGL